MELVEIEDKNSILIEKLLEIWEKSVKETHLFLSETEIENIKKYVPQVYKRSEIDEQGKPYPILYMRLD